VPELFVKRSTGLCLNTLHRNEWKLSLEKAALAMRVMEIHLPGRAIEGVPPS